jgi:hypothetical protein
MLLLPSFLFIKGALVQLYISQFNTCLADLFFVLRGIAIIYASALLLIHSSLFGELNVVIYSTNLGHSSK